MSRTVIESDGTGGEVRIRIAPTSGPGNPRGKVAWRVSRADNQPFTEKKASIVPAILAICTELEVNFTFSNKGVQENHVVILVSPSLNPIYLQDLADRLEDAFAQ